MKGILALAALFFCVAAQAAPEYGMHISEVRCRDPFVLADNERQKYYIVTSHGDKLALLESKDLKMWRDAGICFVPEKGFWGSGIFWAPDMFKRGGRYYVIVTDVSRESKVKLASGEEHGVRGCCVLVADAPEGPYKPLMNAPFTPNNFMSLDATLFEENGEVWALYCLELCQLVDGAVAAQRMRGDLSGTDGELFVLFNASDYKNVQPDHLVTDSPFIKRAPDGTLYMFWSTFDRRGRKYVITYAKSESGKVEGPWTQSGEALNDDDGGHAMLFKSFDGKLMVSYHSPNYPFSAVQDGRPAVLTIREIGFEGGKPALGGFVK